MKLFIRGFYLVLLLSSGIIYTGYAQSEKSPAQQEAQSKQTIKVKVSGITCAGDSKDIQKAVSKVNGILECKQVGKASASTTFEITFNPAQVTEKEIRKAVEDTPGCENPEDRPYKVKG